MAMEEMNKMSNVLSNVDYPASKGDIMSQARNMGDDKVMNMVQKLPDREYDSMSEAMDEVRDKMM